MADYIEREAFIESQQHLYCENCARRKDGKGKFVYDIGDAPCRACGIMDVLDAVEDFPAADVRPVVRGKWIEHYEPYSTGEEMLEEQYGYECSICGRWEYEKEPFCNCGAMMEES